MKFKVEASTAQTKGKLSKQAIDKNEKNVDKDGKTEKKDEGKDKRVKTWHRVGWNMHMESKKSPGQIIPSPFSISETLNKPSHYSGPVYLRAHSHTYNSSKNVQHTHRTTLVHSFCPGIRGAPPAEPNTHFYTELDDQLKRIRKTCSEIRDKNLAIVQGLGNQFQDDDNGYAVQFPNYEDPPLDPTLSSHTTYNRYQYKDTIELRRRVNESYEDQLLFFTHCVATNSGLQASGTCASAAAAAAAAITASVARPVRHPSTAAASTASNGGGGGGGVEGGSIVGGQTRRLQSAMDFKRDIDAYYEHREARELGAGMESEGSSLALTTASDY